MHRPFSPLAEFVYRRTYSRCDSGPSERWPDTVERVLAGNVKGFQVPPEEVAQLRELLLQRKAGPAGRGLWMSGTAMQDRLGGAALNNCWGFTAADPENFVMAQDLLMLGGGVGLTVERQYVDRLPRVKRGVVVEHRASKDAEYIVPDSREGWVELTRRVLEAWFTTGRSFTYSTVCLRPAGTPIRGFGGSASGPEPLIRMVSKLCEVMRAREGGKLRPLDAADVLCSIGEMVVAGNVRRSAILILGDPHDRDYLRAKRWDLGPIPTQRAMANFSVVADDAEHDLRPLFWETYLHGEPFGIVNMETTRRYGRMGEESPDRAVVYNPCAEIPLENGEGCNIQPINLAALSGEEEFARAARLMHRWGKRVALAAYHWPTSQKVISRNLRIGTSLTGCLGAPTLFQPAVLDRVYGEIREENESYARELGVAPSHRLTTIAPGGTWTKAMDGGTEGVHSDYSRYRIQRIRASSEDPALPRLRAAGHHMEPVERFDGSLDHRTQVVDFYAEALPGAPCADEGWTTWHQLDALLMAQRHWADNSVSVTVTYRAEELPRLKAWVQDHLGQLKTVSFLQHSDHGFKQAPKEAISRERYEELTAKLRPVDWDDVGGGELVDAQDCAGGACPVR